MKKLLVSLLFGAGLALAGGAPVYAAGDGPSDAPSAPVESAGVPPLPSTVPSGSTSASPSPSTSPKTQPCDAYYYTNTIIPLCDRFPGAERKAPTCAQIHYRVSLVVKGEDPWDLDHDADGVSCEANKVRHQPSPAASGSTSPAAGNGWFTTAASNDDGGLPVTGSDAGRLALLGAGIIALGMGFTAVAKRRHHRRTKFQA